MANDDYNVNDGSKAHKMHLNFLLDNRGSILLVWSIEWQGENRAIDIVDRLVPGDSLSVEFGHLIEVCRYGEDLN